MVRSANEAEHLNNSRQGDATRGCFGNKSISLCNYDVILTQLSIKFQVMWNSFKTGWLGTLKKSPS